MVNIFEILIDAFPQDNDIDIDTIRQLLFYFESTYVRNRVLADRIREPRFPPVKWNHFDHVVECLPKMRDMAIHRLTLQKSLVENNERRRSKYEDIERRLSLRAMNFFRENNKL